MFNKGQIIHHSRDHFGNILVIDYRKHRVLTFDSIFEQSKINRRYPHLPVHEYSRAMLIPAAFCNPRHVTILGLGGGTITSAFLHLFPECQVHTVELRQAVLTVAREYFGLPDSPRLKITIADARNVLKTIPEASTDMILADLYTAHEMNSLQSRRWFVKHCSRALTPDGWLVLNYHRQPDDEGPFFQQLRKHFAQLLTFKSKTNNTVVYASKQPFEPIHPKAPSLASLEKQLPIGWSKLSAKVNQQWSTL
jgi:spermidine synthase